MVRPRLHPRGAAGFTYLGLIVTVAIIGLVGAAALKVDALLRRAAAEEELLEIGASFSEALRSYADATPRGQPQLLPPSLQDLLRDPRYPGVRRHLRKIFVDPMTGKAEWGIVYASKAGGIGGDGGGSGVLAVYSLSQARPLKLANFDARFQNLENKQHIYDWKFAATGQGLLEPNSKPNLQPNPQPTLQPNPQPTVPSQPGQDVVPPVQPVTAPPADTPSLFRDQQPAPDAPAAAPDGA